MTLGHSLNPVHPRFSRLGIGLRRVYRRPHNDGHLPGRQARRHGRRGRRRQRHRHLQGRELHARPVNPQPLPRPLPTALRLRLPALLCPPGHDANPRPLALLPLAEHVRQPGQPRPRGLPQRLVLGRRVEVLPQPLDAVAREDAEDAALVLRKLRGRLAAELLELVAEEGRDARQAEVGEAGAGV